MSHIVFFTILFLMIIISVIFGSSVYSFNNITSSQGILIGIKYYGNVTNSGSKSIMINETDIMVFDYPLNTSTQRIIDVKAWVNGYEYPYKVIKENTQYVLVIQSPYTNSSLKPGESISVGVEYNVSIDMFKRISSIDNILLTNNVTELVKISGTWSDINYSEIGAECINVTSLWNYTNPLIKLLVNYLNKTINESKPLSIILGILNWIDNNIVYSTRIPPRHPWEVIVEGLGDCDDQSNLLITLARSFKIPSYLEIGIVYIGPNFKYENVEAEGYYHYTFLGGGGHGWVAVYIPPWKWVRVDLTIGSGKGIGHIKGAAYYIFPTVVIDKVISDDYATQSAEYTEEIISKKIKYDLVLEVVNYNLTKK